MLLSRFAHFWVFLQPLSHPSSKPVKCQWVTLTVQCSEVSPSPWQKPFIGCICIHYCSCGILNAADAGKQVKQVSFLKISDIKLAFLLKQAAERDCGEGLFASHAVVCFRCLASVHRLLSQRLLNRWISICRLVSITRARYYKECPLKAHPHPTAATMILLFINLIVVAAGYQCTDTRGAVGCCWMVMLSVHSLASKLSKAS